MQTDLIADLNDIFAQEKTALLSGQYDALIPLEQRKEDALHALAQRSVPVEVLASVQSNLDENQALLAAAIGGMAAARKRIDALNDVRNGLSIYDRSGRKEVVRASNTTLEKKA